MGEQEDNLDEETYSDDGNLEVGEERNKENFFSKLFNFNYILSEIIRLIIYLMFFIIFYYFFIDESKIKIPQQAISNYDLQNQEVFDVNPIGQEIKLDEMLINTSDELETHFVKLTMIISYGSEQTGVEISKRMNEIYDRVRKVIGSKKYNELKFVDGQELLSLEIKNELQKLTRKSDIYNIFFKEFTAY